MADINSVTLIGNLTRDEEVSYTPAGMAVGKFALAINRKVKKGQQWENEVNYFDIVVFGNQATQLQRFLTKGKQVGVTGFLKQERWKGQDGTSRSAIRIIANDIQLLGGNGGQRSSEAPSDNGGFTEDIPF